jgi:hypothetical protein
LPNKDPVPTPPLVCCCRHAVDTPTDPIEHPVATNFPSLESPSNIQASEPPKKHPRIPKAELEASKHCRVVPDLEIFDSLEDAMFNMKVSFGGSLLQDSSKKQAKDNHCWTYKCKHQDEEGHRCFLTVCIKRHRKEEKPKGFSAWMSKPLKDKNPRDMHNHPVDRFKEIGVPSAIKSLVDGMIIHDEVKLNEVMLTIK